MDFLLALVLIVIVSKVASEILERFGFVSLLGEFGTGLLFGMSALAIIHPDDVEKFAFMGVILLMFLAGYEETDLKFMFKRRKKISAIAIGGLILTLIGIFLFSKLYLGLTTLQAMLAAFIFGLTDVAVGAKSLLSTGKLHTESGESLLGIAVVDTVIGLILLAVGLTIATSTTILQGGMTAGKIVMFFLIMIFVAKWLPKLIKKAGAARTEMMEVSIAFCSIFFLAYLAEELKLASVLGAYFAGLILQKAPDLETNHFSTTSKSIAYAFFIPIFFAWIGLGIDLSAFADHWQTALVITLFCIIFKLLASYVMSLSQKAKPKEALIYSVGMSARGADNLVVIAIGANLGILPPEISIIITTSLVMIMLISIVGASIGLKFLLKDAK